MATAQLALDPESLVGALQNLKSQVTASTAATSVQTENVLRCLASPDARVAFGGHFNAGKSTLLNALVNRNILPVDDLPETGIDCWIRSSQEDRAEVVVGEHRTSIAVDCQSIRNWSGLVNKSGDYRPEVSSGSRIFVGLSSSQIPSNAVWVDTMGFNDDAVLDVRLQEISAEIDVLFWVLNSRQPLSEREQAFLADFLASNGPEALIFVMNVILEQDTEAEFNSRLAKNQRAWCNKIVEFWNLAVARTSPPLIIHVAARALSTQPDGFGGPELRAALGQLNGRYSPRVSASRFYRAATLSRELCGEIASNLAELRKEDEPRSDTMEHLLAARHAFDDKNYQGMMMHASAASELAPRLPEPVFLRAIACLFLGQATFAEIAVNRCRLLGKSFPESLFAKGWVDFVSNRHKSAKEFFDAFLASPNVNGPNEYGWTRTVALYLRACTQRAVTAEGNASPDCIEDLCEAAKDAAGLSRIDTVASALLICAGHAVERLSNPQTALVIYKRACDALPSKRDEAYVNSFFRTTRLFAVPSEDTDPLVGLRIRIWEVSKQINGGETRQAVQSYLAADASEEVHGALSPMFCLHMASISVERGHPDEALLWLKSLLRLQPDFDIILAQEDTFIQACPYDLLHTWLRPTMTHSAAKNGFVSNYVTVTNNSAFKVTNVKVTVSWNRTDGKPGQSRTFAADCVKSGESLTWTDVFTDTGFLGMSIQDVSVRFACPELN